MFQEDPWRTTQTHAILWAVLWAKETAMARTPSRKMVSRKIEKEDRPGRYACGNGLYLQVRSPTAKSWLLRYMLSGKATQMGLGTAYGPTALTLAEANEKARDAQRLLRDGIDPMRHREEAARREVRRQGATFRSVGDAYLAAHKDAWRNTKHQTQWIKTLRDVLYPTLGEMPVDEVDVDAVMRVLEPIWLSTTETASRARGRLEAILNYAKARGLRSGDNPAQWRGHLANLLPAPNKIAPTRHHPALPWQETEAFMVALRKMAGIGAKALELTILTAARTDEVLGMKWPEVDLESGVWTVPGTRMKAGRPHRVALSRVALAVLQSMRASAMLDPTGYVFPGNRKGRPLSNNTMRAVLKRMKRLDITVHGFRSTFKDWAREATSHPRDVAEAALAHVLEDKTEAAYARGDMLPKRIVLMADWADYCDGTTRTGVVIEMRQSNRSAEAHG